MPLNNTYRVLGFGESSLLRSPTISRWIKSSNKTTDPGPAGEGFTVAKAAEVFGSVPSLIDQNFGK